MFKIYIKDSSLNPVGGEHINFEATIRTHEINPKIMDQVVSILNTHTKFPNIVKEQIDDVMNRENKGAQVNGVELTHSQLFKRLYPDEYEMNLQSKIHEIIEEVKSQVYLARSRTRFTFPSVEDEHAGVLLVVE